MAELTDLEGADEFTASDDEVQAAVEETAEALGMTTEAVHEEVAYILSSGSDTVLNEGVGGVGAGANADSQGDPRLEALEVFRLRQEI